MQQSEQSSAFDSTGFSLSSIESKPVISLYLDSVLVECIFVEVCSCAFGMARSMSQERRVASDASLFAKLSNVPETSVAGKGVRA